LCKGDSVYATNYSDERFECGRVGRGVTLDGDEKWSVEARAESFGEHVVGTAHRGRLGSVAVVAESKSDRQQWRAEEEKYGSGAERRRPWATLDETTPAVPERFALRLAGTLGDRLTHWLDGETREGDDNRAHNCGEEEHQRLGDDREECDHDERSECCKCGPCCDVDAVLDHCEERRKQRDRRNHHDEHSDHGADSEAASEGKTHDEQSKEGDDDRDTGEDHRTT